MSLILDALRRADAERERGSVPTLHGQPAGVALAGLGDPRDASRRSPAWLWGGAIATLVLLISAAWFWLHREQPAPAPVPVPVPAPVLQAPVKTSPTPALAVPAPVLATPPPRPAEAKTAAAAVPKLSELPEALRRELPALVPGGAMYSELPAQRMLILNGQVFHEGDQVTPQLVLEQIQLRGAVLSFKGQRYTISF